MPYVAPIPMLSLSNVFMTFAWYGHLKHKAGPLIAVIRWTTAPGFAFIAFGAAHVFMGGRA